MLKDIHKILSLSSLVLNGSALCSKYVSPDMIKAQLTEFEGSFPNGILRGTYDNVKSLQWDKLKENSNAQFLLSKEGILKSGIAGLAELKFSEYIFGQTTHFGIVYPALVLAYGDEWNAGNKVLFGLAAVGAFEITYWWSNDDVVDLSIDV